jgi:hypothetical protein
MKPEIRAELKQLLANDDLLLGQIFNAMESGITNAAELVEATTAASRGVVYNYQKMTYAILDGTLPNGAAVSLMAARAISRLIKRNPEIHPETLAHLTATRERLMENAEASSAVQHDQELIEAQSAALETLASTIQSGIYVYSFPTYLYYGTVEDRELYWLKIGSTKNSVWHRIVEQNRQTSMPEDPKLLRIYHKENMDIEAIEKKFHSTLDRVGHERSAARRTKAGKEWFATTLDAIDAIAELMELEIERYEDSELFL